MTTQFYLNPRGGVLRSAIAGQSAISPAAANDIMFDAFGPPLQAPFAAATIPFSSLSGPTSFTPSSSSVSTFRGAHYWLYALTFSSAFSLPPQFVVYFEDPSTSGWTPSYAPSTITYHNVGGDIVPYGSAGGSFAYTTTTQLLIYWYTVDYENPATLSPPSNISYRVFRL